MLQRENRLKTPFYKATWIPFDESKETLRQYAERVVTIDEKWAVERKMFCEMIRPKALGLGVNQYKLSKRMKKFWYALIYFFDEIEEDEFDDYDCGIDYIISEVRKFFAKHHPKITVFEGILYDEAISFQDRVNDYLDDLEDEEDDDEDFDFDDVEGDDYE